MKRILFVLPLLFTLLTAQTEINKTGLTSVPNSLGLPLLITQYETIPIAGDSMKVSFLLGNPHNCTLERVVLRFHGQSQTDSTVSGSFGTYVINTPIKPGYWKSASVTLKYVSKLFIYAEISVLSMERDNIRR